MQFAKDLIDGKISVIIETEVIADDPAQLGVRLGVKLGVNQIEIIKLIQSNRKITIAELAKSIKVSEVSIYKNIKKLKNYGIIERIGSDKTGFWRVK